MKKYFFYMFLVVFVLFNGCSKPNALNHFSKDELYNKSLQHTFKRDIVTSSEVKAMLSATYLNAMSSKFNSKTHEQFLVGIFRTSSVDSKNEEYLKGVYSLTLNDINYDFVEVLDKNHELYGKVALFNPWAKYYLVKFNKEKLNKKYQENFTTYEKYNNLDYKSITIKLTDLQDNLASITYQREL